MRKLFAAAAVVFGGLFSSGVHGQAFDYHVYLNTDLRAVTGCTVTAADGQSMAGVDFRLTASVAGSPPTVTELRLAGCAGGNFGPGVLIGGGYPVGLNNGVALGGGAFADVIELSVSRQQVAGAMPSILVGFGAQDGDSLDDGVFTRNGEFGGPPMSIGSYQQIPSAGVVGLLLLGVLLLLAAGVAMRRNGPLTRVMLVGACLVFSLAAWAANFALDGQVDDWAGIAPLATDQTGDSPLSGTDIVAAFGVDDDPDLRFRIDVVDAENRPPIAVDDAYTVLEDQTLTVPAPGVLGNDSDPDGNPITAQGFTAPNFGVLDAQPDGSFTFAGLADENGTATFSYFAFDGQVLSQTPATVTVTVTPVNDAPSFTASNPPAVNEDTGAQTVANWASFSPGPANESDQNVLAYTVSAVSNGALFSAAPSVGNDGTLSYTPAPDANGSSQFTVVVRDDGGTANGGVDTSAPQTFTITVNPVNDAPSFLAGPNQTVLEDAGPQVVNPWATAISPGPADEAGQTLTFNVTGNSNAALFSAGPVVSPTGGLSYTPAANANGSATITLTLTDNGGTANGGVDTSAPQSFTITVTPVNDAPSFIVGADQVVNEDAGPQTVSPWASNIDDGDPEVVQGLTFQITSNSNPGLFSAAPAVSPTGVLSFTSAADANGSATITLQLMDDGGTANGGVDTSAAQTFTITVNAVNDAPSFVVGPDQTVLEDAGPQMVNPWATAISPGPADEAGQGLIFTITGNSNPALFSAGPAVSPAGVLSYTPAANANGSATISLALQDDGGTANGGVDTSAPQTFTITVTAVNDAPSFLVGPDVTVAEDAGAQTITPWATAISAGPPDESGQTLSFQITGNSNAGLFSAGPAVSPGGALSFTSAANASGVATITLRLMDNGGTANGGVDVSATQQFTISVTAVNDPPVNAVPGPQSVNEDASLAFSGASAISVSDVDIAAGTLTVDLTVADGTLTASAAGAAVVSNSGTAALQINGLLADVNASLGSLVYSPDPDYSGADTLTVTSNDNGNTGSGGPQSDVDTVAITVNPINDAPVNTVPGPQTVAGGLIVFSAANGNALSVVDVDADPGNVQVDVSVTDGTLSAVATPGVTISNNGSAAVTLLGLQAAVNAALDGLTYVAAGAGTDTLIMLSSDLGNSGAGGVLTDTDTVTLLIDEAPSVTASTPGPGATTANNPALSITFSEAINAASNYATLSCGGPNLITAGQTGSNATVLTPTYAGPLPNGAACTLTILAAAITDVDLIDPPDTMAANYVVNFSVDAAPEVTSTLPANGATDVALASTITVNFSEAVNVAAGGISLDCGGAIAFVAGPLPASNVTSVVLTPSSPLPATAVCTGSVLASAVTDVDAIDPPDTMAANFSWSFTTLDLAPEVINTTPANGDVDVNPTSNITINFSESVNFDTAAGAANTSFDLDCPMAAGFTVVTASPSASVVLDPTDTGVAGASCVLTVRAAGITDADLIDPPNNMAADFSASFTYGAIAVDDAYTVTPHLTLGIGAGGPQGGGVLANDILGAGGITGFGFAPACSGASVGSQLDAGAANGRLTLNADGSFGYEPPAGVANATRTFCYTVSGGDTANIVFTLQNTELVWFVNSAVAAGGIGTQARPFQTLGAAAAVDTPNDTIFLAFNATPYTGGITLEAGERLIGQGSGSDLATITGITPVAGSAFPALGGSAPAIACTGVNCLSLSTGNTLRGFNVGNAGAAGTKIAGTAFDTLTVAELTLSGDGRALGLTTGTLNGTFIDIDVTTGNLQAIALDAVGGTWSVTNQVSIGNVGGTAMNIINTPAGGSATFTGGVSINKTSAGAGVNFNANASPINLGAVSITTGAGTALTIDNSAGATTIASGSVSATGGAALNSSASALAVALSGATSATSPTQGINLNGITGSVVIGNGGSISGSTGTAFAAQATLGTTSYAGTISKTSAGRLVDVTGAGAGTLTLSGNLSCTGACGTGAGNHGLRVNARNAGSYTFSGATQTFSASAANPGISLTDNTGATISFTGGGLAITTTDGAGFNASGGGTVSVTGSANTVTTTAGTAVNVSNTSIGAAGMTWRSVNSTTASANTTIILTNTGAGAFSVTGTGAAGTGGTISNKTVDAVQLSTTGGLVTLDQMIIEDIGAMGGGIDTRSGHDAIQGLNVNAGLSLTGTTIRRISDQAIHGGTQGSPDTATVWNGLILSGVTIENTNRFHVAGSGDANNESTVRILGIRGAVNVTNSTFSLGSQPLDLEVTAGTLTFTATGNFFDRAYKEFTSGVRASVGNHCIDVRVLAGATASVTIGSRTTPAQGNNFLNCRIGSVRVVNQPGAGANTVAIIANNNFRVNDHSSGIGGDFDFPMGGALVWNLGSGALNTVVENNLFELVTNASGGVGQLSLIAEGGPVQALVLNNTFDRPGNAPWWVQARNSAAAVMTARFANNTVIRGPFPCTIDPACGGGYIAPGLRALADANTGATMNFTMQNNVMARHDTGFDPGQTVEVRALNSGAAPTVCANFQNNQSPDGYSLEQLLGTVRTVGTGTCPAGSPSANCQAVLGNRGNQGSAGVGTAVPPFVNVFGTVTVNAVDCPLPSGAPF